MECGCAKDRALRFFRRCSMHDAVCRLPRIPLPRCWVHRVGYGRFFLLKNTPTTPPDKKVSTPTEPMAQVMPNVSAMIPAERAPTA
jgi:hypothetical protein